MTLTYQYPVVYFYGDDEEDSEIIRKEGQIEPLKTDKEPYEAIVSADDTAFISCLDLRSVECFCAFLDGIWDVNCLI